MLLRREGEPSGKNRIYRLYREEGLTVRTTPIYVLSANAMPEDIAKSMAAGTDGHISKPIEANRLLDQVSQAIVAVRSTQLANVA
mgnify:CR=1 FL=1